MTLQKKKTRRLTAFVCAICLAATGCRQPDEGGNNIPSLDEVTLPTTEATEVIAIEPPQITTAETTTTTVTTTEITEEETEEEEEEGDNERENDYYYENEEYEERGENEEGDTTTSGDPEFVADKTWNETYMIAREMYVTEKCYSRERAVVGSVPISQFFEGDVITVVGVTDTEYYMLEGGGYIHFDYVSDRKPSVNEIQTAPPESEEQEEETKSKTKKPKQTTVSETAPESEKTAVVSTESSVRVTAVTSEKPVTEVVPEVTGGFITGPSEIGFGSTVISGTGSYSKKSSTRYGYKQLNSKEQTLYNNIVDSVMNLEQVVPVPEGMSKNDIVKVYSVVYNCEPQLFWMGSSISAGTSFANISYRVTDKNEIAAMQKEIDNAASKILSKANNYSGTVSKLKVFFDTLVTQSEFVVSDDGFSSSIYNGLTGKGGLQCAGYAKTMQYLCDMAGIDCMVIVGTQKAGVTHAWNVVYCDNGYYNLDATWGDPINDYGPDYVQYEYFLVPDSWIHNKSHFNVNTTFRSDGTAVKLYNPPACTKEACNYFAAYNKLFSTTEEAEKGIYAEIDSAIKEGRNTAEIRVTSDAVYKELTSTKFATAIQKYAKEKSSKVSKLKIHSSEFGVVHYDVVYK